MLASATGAEIERFRLFRGDVVVTKDSESPDDIAVPAYIAPVLVKLSSADITWQFCDQGMAWMVIS